MLVRLGFTGLLLLPWVVTLDFSNQPLEFWLWMIFLIPLEITAMWLYIKAIRDYPLSLTVPYLAFTPVLVILTGWLVLNESISIYGFSGIFLIVAGSWLLNFESIEQLTPSKLLAPFKAILSNPGSRLMLITAAIYSVTAVGGKAASEWMDPSELGAFYFVLAGTVVLIAVAIHKPIAIKIALRHFWPSLIVAALMAAMVVTHFSALSKVEAAYMIAAKRTSLLFGILYGALLFGEQHLSRHLIAGSLMVLGVLVIALN